MSFKTFRSGGHSPPLVTLSLLMIICLSHPLLSQTPHPVPQEGQGAGPLQTLRPAEPHPCHMSPWDSGQGEALEDWGPGAGEAKNTV